MFVLPSHGVPEQTKDTKWLPFFEVTRPTLRTCAVARILAILAFHMEEATALFLKCQSDHPFAERLFVLGKTTYVAPLLTEVPALVDGIQRMCNDVQIAKDDFIAVFSPTDPVLRQMSYITEFYPGEEHLLINVLKTKIDLLGECSKMLKKIAT